MNVPNPTPARIVLAVAAAGVIGNLCLMLADALAPQTNATARPMAPSSVEAMRGRFPGEPRLNRDTPRWKAL